MITSGNLESHLLGYKKKIMKKTFNKKPIMNEKQFFIKKKT